MNTVAFKVPDAMATRLLLRSVLGKRRGRPYGYVAMRPSRAARSTRRHANG